MITMRGDDPNGAKVAILGITQENVQRLMAGEPIAVPLHEIGIHEVRVVIVYGDTEQKIIRRLEELGAVPPGTASDMPAVKKADDQFTFNTREEGEWKRV